MEVGLTRVLQEQIAMAPRGRYRTALESHLRETREHAERVAKRRRELRGRDSIGALVSFAQDAAGQALALAKTPLDLVRGSCGEEKVLKNAKDACATEALEIATYTALEALARGVDDAATAGLAASLRADEEAMLQRIQGELPALARAVVAAEIDDDASYDIVDTGAAQAVRGAAKKAASETGRAARQARRVPGVSQAEGAVRGAVADESDLPIADYDALNADDVVGRLRELSQVDLAKVEVYERRNDGRTTVLDRIAALYGDEPWAGYDAATAQEIIDRLRDGDEQRAARARDYERAHKARTTVLRAAEREIAHA